MSEQGHPTRRAAIGWIGTAATTPLAARPAPSAAIDTTSFVPLGGIDQWIDIKGDDPRNPLLLVLHGGPGEAQWPEAARYRPWQKHFTVVQWDQRGAGHTYGRYGAATPELTLARLAGDATELADRLCRRFGKRRIVVLGHSWGSTIGGTMAARHPERIAAYVGTGQVGSWRGAILAKYERAVAEARAAGDVAAVGQLEAAGPPDATDAKAVFAFSDRLFDHFAPADIGWIRYLRGRAPELQRLYPQDFKDFQDGFRFSARQVLPDQMKVDLPATAGTIDTAVFLLQGRDDLITPTSDAVHYFDRLEAPYKDKALLPDAGHFAFMTSGEAFLDLLIARVRPVAIARGG